MTDILLDGKNLRLPPGVDDHTMVQACLGILTYGLFEGRNAWWQAWSTTYSAPHLRIADTKAAAERRRTQGSQFTLISLPAVAFVSPPHTLIFTRADGSDWLPKQLAPNTLPRSLKAIAGVLSTWTIPPYYLFYTDSIDFVAIPDSLNVWKSEPRGTGYSLGWVQTDDRPLSSKAVKAFVASYNAAHALAAI